MLDFKAAQSQRNWNAQKIAYIVLFVLIVIVILIVNSAKLKESKGFSEARGKIADGNGPLYAKGRGSDHDSTEDLLNRIQWATYLDRRMVRWYRIVAITIIVTLLICVLAIRKLPKVSTILIIMLSVFIPVSAAQNLYYVHGDIYNDYYIHDNVKRLRKRLFGNERYEEPPSPRDNLPTRAQVMNPN